MENIRKVRNNLLAQSDWTQLSDVALTEDQKSDWKKYRQELRDLPENCDPKNPIYPSIPIL
jgi:hypothetical protein